jgi:hypothetical protein
MRNAANDINLSKIAIAAQQQQQQQQQTATKTFE